MSAWRFCFLKEDKAVKLSGLPDTSGEVHGFERDRGQREGNNQRQTEELV